MLKSLSSDLELQTGRLSAKSPENKTHVKTFRLTGPRQLPAPKEEHLLRLTSHRSALSSVFWS